MPLNEYFFSLTEPAQQKSGTFIAAIIVTKSFDPDVSHETRTG